MVVLGGGLAGLTAARDLCAAGSTVTVVEARSFVGGRTMTMRAADLGEGAWFDVGATWHWDDQPLVRALARDVGVEAFAQYRQGLARAEQEGEPEPESVEIPPPSPAELRFAGGAQLLCERVAAGLPPGSVLLDTTAVAVEANNGDGSGAGVTVNVAGADGASRDLAADAVIVAIPPRLLVENVAFTPDLPEDVQHAQVHTPTWMARALKCVAVYDEPFWRDAGLSGLAFSDSGPLREVHDCCSPDGSVAALWGFVSPLHEFRDPSFDDRLEMVFAQLARFFGKAAADPLRYFERDWSGDPFTNDEVFYAPDDLEPYGHPSFSRPLWDGRLALAGAETAAEGGGHMEGAVASGHRAAKAVLRTP